MKTNKEKSIDDFLMNVDEADSNEIEARPKLDDNKKFIKSDNSIIERVDKIIIAENGKQLLREWY
jgi:hypothetical protein